MLYLVLSKFIFELVAFFIPGTLEFHFPDQIQTWILHREAISWPVVFRVDQFGAYLVPKYSKRGNLLYYHHFQIHLDSLICILLHHNHPLSDHNHTIAITTRCSRFAIQTCQKTGSRYFGLSNRSIASEYLTPRNSYHSRELPSNELLLLKPYRIFQNSSCINDIDR